MAAVLALLLLLWLLLTGMVSSGDVGTLTYFFWVISFDIARCVSGTPTEISSVYYTHDSSMIWSSVDFGTNNIIVNKNRYKNFFYCLDFVFF